MTFYIKICFRSSSLGIGISTCHFWLIWNLESREERREDRFDRNKLDLCIFRTPLKTRKAWQTHKIWMIGKNFISTFYVVVLKLLSLYIFKRHDVSCISLLSNLIVVFWVIFHNINYYYYIISRITFISFINVIISWRRIIYDKGIIYCMYFQHTKCSRKILTIDLIEMILGKNLRGLLGWERKKYIKK